MPINFDVNVAPQDLYRFSLKRAYTGFQGIFSILLGIGIIVVAFMTLGERDTARNLMAFAIGIVSLCYIPAALWTRSKRQYEMNPALMETQHFTIDDSGIHLQVKDQKADMDWKLVYRIVSNKRYLLIYSSRVHAYIIPQKDVGEKRDAILALARQKLEPYRLKVKV